VRIARWNGASWSAVGRGASSEVEVLCAYDDGAKSWLVAGGHFVTMDGVTVNRIARYDGSSWSALGTGPVGASNAVHGLRPHDDGGEPVLLAAGAFVQMDGLTVNRVARYSGCPSALESVPGCHGNPAALVALTPAARIGRAFSVRLEAGAVAGGVGMLYGGDEGTGPGGCGLLLPGLGELLLATAPQPLLVGQKPLVASRAVFTLPIPNDAGLVGSRYLLQGVAVGAAPPSPLELSTGLRIRLLP
jgi:hypothetical protein